LRNDWQRKLPVATVAIDSDFKSLRDSTGDAPDCDEQATRLVSQNQQSAFIILHFGLQSITRSHSINKNIHNIIMIFYSYTILFSALIANAAPVVSAKHMRGVSLSSQHVQFCFANHIRLTVRFDLSA